MKKKKNVLLIQPQAEWGKHPYLINGLIAVATRLQIAGIDSMMIDLNVSSLNFCTQNIELNSFDWIGVGVLGAPYIPPALRLAKQLRKEGQYSGRIFLGGPVMANITINDWNSLFESQKLLNITAIQEEVDLKIQLGLATLASINQCSMATVIRGLPEEMKKNYFSKEFCLFTSDGCIFNCNFCAAHKGRTEEFREPNQFRDEIQCIARMVKKYAGEKPAYEIYLSTLDGLQNPVKMEQVLHIIHEEFKNAGTFVPLRFLATSRFTYKALQNDRDILKRWFHYGVRCIGIGADGADEETWLRIRKGHNKPGEIEAALIGIQDAGMVAEAFMIFGFPDEPKEATVKAVHACRTLTEQNIKVRPYLAKNNPPGTEGFSIAPFLKKPNLFLHLDYGMIGSELTHPNKMQREFVNTAYIETIEYLQKNNVHGCPTNPLRPTEEGTEMERTFNREWNSNMPMDR